jgi:tetratricopeptide (TPR) repeat protein
VQKAGYVGNEADAGYPLCEQALRVDPNNVRALGVWPSSSSCRLIWARAPTPRPTSTGRTSLLSQALALDLTNAGVHNEKAWVLQSQGRFEEAIAERERTLALDPGDVSAIQGMAWDHLYLGRFDKSLELFDEAIRLSPRDPELQFMENGKSWAHFGLKQYDQTIDWARPAAAVGTSFSFPHAALAAALALTGHEAEAREARGCAACPRANWNPIRICASREPPPSVGRVPRPLTSVAGELRGLEPLDAREHGPQDRLALAVGAVDRPGRAPR